MPMVQVGVVRVSMGQRRVSMPMHVRLAGGHAGLVFMLMMFVVSVPMLVRHRLVRMLVFVPLRQMQP
jgi:hypothetical protein